MFGGPASANSFQESRSQLLEYQQAIATEPAIAADEPHALDHLQTVEDVGQQAIAATEQVQGEILEAIAVASRTRMAERAGNLDAVRKEALGSWPIWLAIHEALVVSPNPIDVHLRGNHKTPPLARLNQLAFETYYQRNIFRLSSSGLTNNPIVVQLWIDRYCRPWKLRHMRNITFELTVHYSDSAGAAPSVNISSLRPLFALFSKLFYAFDTETAPLDTLNLALMLNHAHPYFLVPAPAPLPQLILETVRHTLAVEVTDYLAGRTAPIAWLSATIVQSLSTRSQWEMDRRVLAAIQDNLRQTLHAMLSQPQHMQALAQETAGQIALLRPR